MDLPSGRGRRRWPPDVTVCGRWDRRLSVPVAVHRQPVSPDRAFSRSLIWAARIDITDQIIDRPFPHHSPQRLTRMTALAKQKDRAANKVKAVHGSKHWVTLPNERLYRYVAAGDPSKPCLVLLHGYTDSWRSFDPILPFLQEHFHLIALDQRGHGDTGDDFLSFDIDDFVIDAIAFVAQLTHLPVNLLGHSLGSLVAQRVAAAQPELIDRLILIGASDTA